MWGGGGETETETDRQTDRRRQTDRQKQRDRQTDRQTDRQKQTEAKTEKDKKRQRGGVWGDRECGGNASPLESISAVCVSLLHLFILLLTTKVRVMTMVIIK